LPNPAATRILVADDHGIVREGLTLLLERESGLKVVGVAATSEQAVASAVRLKPDVVVMDLALPQLGGIDAIERILKLLPQTHIVVLSASHSSEQVFRALTVGAIGYVVKGAASTDLVLAVKAASIGERYLSASVTALVVEGLLSKSPARSPIESLSGREREVLQLTVAGLTSAAIGTQLSLSRKTVDTYRSRVMEKLHVQDRSALIHFAIAHALGPT
jgi:two-component system, NarL family, response regulator NreC